MKCHKTPIFTRLLRCNTSNLILQKVKAQRLLGLLRELAEAEVEVAQVEHLARILDPHNDDRLGKQRILNIFKYSQVA